MTALCLTICICHHHDAQGRCGAGLGVLQRHMLFSLHGVCKKHTHMPRRRGLSSTMKPSPTLQRADQLDT